MSSFQDSLWSGAAMCMQQKTEAFRILGENTNIENTSNGYLLFKTAWIIIFLC